MHLKNLGRPRLLAELDDGANLSVLNAPPGSGKTQLLRTWVSRTSGSRPVVWCALPPGAHDLPGFWDAIGAAAAHSGHIRPQLTAMLPDLAGGGPPARRALATLFSHHPGLVVVIDNLHHVVDGLDELWDDLITVAEAYPTVRLFVATRSVPRDMLARLQLRPAVRVFGSPQLAFSVEETAELLSDAGHLPDSDDLAQQVTEETRGHALSVLTAVVASDSRSGGSPVTWRRTVTEQLFRDLEALDVHEFVHSTSLAPHLDLELASRLTGATPEELAPLFAQLERNGYGSWVPSASGDLVFELTPSVREAFRTDHESAPQDTDRAAIVCAYLDDRGQVGEALVLAVRHRLYEQASRLYRRLVVTEPFSVTSELEPALRAIPTDEIKKYPILSVARGVALLASPGTSAGAIQFLLPIADRDPASVHESSADDELLELTAQSVVLSVLGRHEEAAHAALEAAHRVAEPEFARAVDPVLATPLACQLSQSLFEAGHVAAAQRLLAQGIAVAAPEMVRFCAIYGRAWYALDGRLPEGVDMDSRVSEGADHPRAAAAGVTWGPRTHDAETVGRAVLLLDRWEFAAAAEAVTEEQTPRWDHSRSWRAWVRIHAAMGLGTSSLEVQRITTSLEAASAPPGSLGLAALGNAMAIAWLANGQVARARRALDLVDGYQGQVAPARLLIEMNVRGPENALNLLPDLRAAEGHTVRSLSALVTLAAAAALRTGARTLASSLLLEAATLQSEHGSRAHLLYLPEADRTDLQALAEATGPAESRAYLRGLPERAQQEISPHVALTSREQAVLEALSVHSSRFNVAQALHVSENTVKSQMRSLYRKLGVTDRSSAISRAVELDLLHADPADDN